METEPEQIRSGPDLRNGNASERVTEAELHYSRRSLNAREIRPIRGRSGRTRVERNADACPAKVHLSEMLSVRHVERLPANLEPLIFTPGQLKGLA